MLTTRLQPRSADCSKPGTATKDATQVNYDRPALPRRLGDRFVPHLTASCATSGLLICAGSSQDETSRAGCDCITRYCRVAPHVPGRRIGQRQREEVSIAVDGCEVIGENRPMLSGPSTVFSFLPTLLSGDDRACPRQHDARLWIPTNPRARQANAAASGMRASRMRMRKHA